ncbi:hypothetical protein [Gloeobacter violaceus]|uniref:hypothetical protein n=1 Tax=Gloeobacter violaceus TaxID=33072 RepID=UPI0013E8F31A|nr:hypothetical protein [Gloeobacter violaceus]
MSIDSTFLHLDMEEEDFLQGDLGCSESATYIDTLHRNTDFESLSQFGEEQTSGEEWHEELQQEYRPQEVAYGFQEQTSLDDKSELWSSADYSQNWTENPEHWWAQAHEDFQQPDQSQGVIDSYVATRIGFGSETEGQLLDTDTDLIAGRPTDSSDYAGDYPNGYPDDRLCAFEHELAKKYPETPQQKRAEEERRSMEQVTYPGIYGGLAGMGTGALGGALGGAVGGPAGMAFGMAVGSLAGGIGGTIYGEKVRQDNAWVLDAHQHCEEHGTQAPYTKPDKP